jgi:hypothetical protein
VDLTQYSHHHVSIFTPIWPNRSKAYIASLQSDGSSNVVVIHLKGDRAEDTFEGSKWKFAPREIVSKTEGVRSLLYQPLCPDQFTPGTDEVRLLTADNQDFFPQTVRDLLDTKGWRTDMQDSDWTLLGIKIDLPTTAADDGADRGRVPGNVWQN